MILNGLWEFQPIGNGGGEEAAREIRVPSSWSSQDHSVLYGGVSLPDLTQAVYRRKVEIPSNWSGRRIVLDLRRVSTEAEVKVNGRECGRVDWPSGEVDVMDAVRPGEAAEIAITVTAKTPEGESWVLMGYATEEKKKRTLGSRGLIGDVILRSEPNGPRIADVFAKPSIRKKSLDLEVELTGATPGLWEFAASLRGANGTEEQAFTAKAIVGAGGKVELSFPWENPRLWDLGKPEIYTLWLSAKPESAKDPVDVFPLVFGFREFWIEGKDFYLNGNKIRLRPRGGHGNPSHQAEIRSFIEGSRAAGFNISQIWPEDASEPGFWNFWELFAEEASKAGWALIGAAPSAKQPGMNAINGQPAWSANPEVRKAWTAAMEREMKRQRNFPAILMWGTSPNLNNHLADQNPRFLGQKAKLLKVPQWPEKEKVVTEAIEEIRRVDPTRPIFCHAGSRLGDVFTVNHYLNVIPLQEREEMLSEYIQRGDVPYVGIEFGTPLNTTMNRGRAGFGPSHESEPFATEYTAIYLGSAAYTKEPRAYRRNVRFGYTGKNWGGDWTQMQWLQSSGEPFQELQALFIKNTWRSWRASGVTGGMIPWNDLNQIFLIRDKSKREPVTPPEDAQRGPQPTTLALMNTNFLMPEGGWIEMASAKALRENNGPTLGFIGGPEPTEADSVAFTAKDHNFREGSTVQKTAVLINDTGTAQPYNVRWSATVGGQELTSKSEQGTIAQAQTLFLPIQFAATGAKGKTDGEIRLEGEIGEAKIADTFAFRVFSPPAAARPPGVLVFDPEGSTTAMLAGLGIPTKAWDGKPAPVVLVIGREALSKNHKPPGPLAEFVRAGGRVVLFAQSPAYLRDAMGFRVSEHVGRRVFPIQADHPALRGLDADDLRDWSATGTLVEAKPEFPTDSHPTFGLRWGNRGSVSSAMVEKPHRSGWRPLLEGDFDLAYTPLMEISSGKGLAILCTLDLEDAWKTDPAAAHLAMGILAYAASASPQPVRQTVFIGNDEDFRFLTQDLGLVTTKATSLAGAGLAVIGPGSNLSPTQLEAFARSGGNVVILAQNTPGNPGLAGGAIKIEKSFVGSRKPPAPAPSVSGLSVSDLRLRSDLDWPVFEGSPESVCDGLVHIRELGRGRIVQTQFEPRWFETEKMPMFRLTRWRHTRALSQILANAGATFAADERTLDPKSRRLDLSGEWKVKITAPLPLAPWEKPLADPGISVLARQAVDPKFNDSAWDSFDLPAWYPPFEKQSGEAVWRKSVTIPPEWDGQILQISLGPVKTYDTTYLNGKEIGSTGSSVKDAWKHPRRYRIPANAVRGGNAVIAVREFVTDFQGGLHGRPQEMFLRPVAAESKSQDLYHADYREEFDFGDNPHRYYRW